MGKGTFSVVRGPKGGRRSNAGLYANIHDKERQIENLTKKIKQYEQLYEHCGECDKLKYLND